MNTLIDFFPFVVQTKTNIENQNRFLRKISLTGKINALDDTVNLFTYTDKTIEKFEQLKDKLIAALVEENIKKYRGELGLNATFGIDILTRNLFERTADVGFLATDTKIISFLEGALSKDIMQAHLQEYVAKYSVYDDVVLLDTKGHIKATINPDNKTRQSHDSIIKEAIKSDTYVERFAKTDIFGREDKCLMYLQKVTYKSEVLGVLALSFKFQDELKQIFDAISFDSQVLVLEDVSGVIATSDASFAPKEKKLLVESGEGFDVYRKRYISIVAKTNGYQGYFGLDWKMRAISHKRENSQSSAAYKKQLLSSKLKDIIDEAHEVVEDLGDVIINGELIASKNRVYTLTPILDNLRNISNALLADIDKSAEKLADLTTQTLISKVKIATKFSIDVMDRNLYERANDCRWWAWTPSFAEELTKDEVDSEKLNTILHTINDLYTVYTNIFIYDTKGNIVASSKDKSIINQHFDAPYLSSILHNQNSQRYFVSQFETSGFYDNRPTYIYNASINHKDKTLGGIAVVFDSEPEFKKILEDSFLEGEKGFSLFCDTSKMILSSTHHTLNPLDKINLPDKYFSEKMTEAMYDFIRYEEKSYLLCVAPSLGYREYKKKDGYKNPLFALSFIEL